MKRDEVTVHRKKTSLSATVKKPLLMKHHRYLGVWNPDRNKPLPAESHRSLTVVGDGRRSPYAPCFTSLPLLPGGTLAMRRRPLAQPAPRPGRPAFPPSSPAGCSPAPAPAPARLLRGECGVPARLCQDRMAPRKPRLRSQPLDPPFLQQPGTGSSSARCPAGAASFVELGYRCCRPRLGAEWGKGARSRLT